MLRYAVYERVKKTKKSNNEINLDNCLLLATFLSWEDALCYTINEESRTPAVEFFVLDTVMNVIVKD